MLHKFTEYNKHVDSVSYELLTFLKVMYTMNYIITMKPLYIYCPCDYAVQWIFAQNELMPPEILSVPTLSMSVH